MHFLPLLRTRLFFTWCRTIPMLFSTYWLLRDLLPCHLTGEWLFIRTGNLFLPPYFLFLWFTCCGMLFSQDWEFGNSISNTWPDSTLSICLGKNFSFSLQFLMPASSYMHVYGITFQIFNIPNSQGDYLIFCCFLLPRLLGSITINCILLLQAFFYFLLFWTKYG